MHWVLQNNIFREEAYDNLVEVLERFDIPYSEHRVIPFVGTLVPVNGAPDLDDIELNTLNSCGFYKANLTSLVLALEQSFNVSR